MLAPPTRKRPDSQAGASPVPVHVAAQISLNKLTLKKLTSAVERDPAEDLTVILADLSKLYPPKRKTATEKRPPIRRARVAENGPENLHVNSYVPPPSLNIYHPLESTALKALSLLEDSSQSDVDDRLLQLPEILEQGEPLLAKKVVALGNDVVVKFGKTIDPTELHIMQYLTINCPAVKCPKPLGFVVHGKVRYLFMTRVQGSTLHSLWPSLMAQQRERVRNSLEEMLSAMRSLVWTPGTPLGTLSEPYICQDARTGYVRTGGPFYNEAEFNSFLLRDPLPRISSSYLRWMQSCLRDDHKIVMTHGDLNPHNIILRKEDDGSVSVSGLIDWALGGWYPEYWDAVKALNIRGTDDESDWWCSLPWTLNQFTAEVAINRLLESCTR